MTRYFLRRLGQAIPIILLVATLVFSLIHLIPGDPVEMMLGDGAQRSEVDQLRSQLDAMRPPTQVYDGNGDRIGVFAGASPVTASDSGWDGLIGGTIRHFIVLSEADFVFQVDLFDGVINAPTGGGPAGISASLTAKKHNLSFLTLEQDTLGGTVYNFPRAKIVMTSPMNLPLYGKVKLFDTSKDELLDFINHCPLP